jgi:hypothetical protein
MGRLSWTPGRFKVRFGVWLVCGGGLGVTRPRWEAESLPGVFPPGPRYVGDSLPHTPRKVLWCQDEVCSPLDLSGGVGSLRFS